MIKIIVASVLLFTRLLIADGHASIDTQITAIKNASPSERVKLMNAFKIRVSQMNTQERSVAIKNMHSKMNSKSTPMRSSNMQQIGTTWQNIHQEQVQYQYPTRREDMEPYRENPREDMEPYRENPRRK